MHGALLEKYPKLLAAIVASSVPGKTQVALPLNSPRGTSSPEVGHVLVKWLYSDTYQLHAQHGEPSPEEAFKTAIGVYALAEQYGLPDLKELAREQATLVGDLVDIYTIIDAVLEVTPPKSQHDEWLDEFLASRTRASLRDDPMLAAMPADEVQINEEDTSITQTIVRHFLGAYRDKSAELAAREAALEEATLALAAQQMTFANALKESAEALAPATPDSRRGKDKTGAGSDYELAPEEVPSAFAMAIVEELALSRSAAASPEDDWVVTSPRAAEPEPEEVVVSTKKNKKEKKSKRRTVVPDPEPEPQVEPEPVCELEAVCEPEPEPVPKHEPAQESVAALDTDTWGIDLFGGGVGKKSKKKKMVVFDPEPEPVPVPGPEPEGAQEPETPPDLWGFGVGKKSKKTKKVVLDPEPEPKAELDPVPVPEPEPAQESVTPLDFWGRPVGKKSKKTKKVVLEPEPEPEPVPEQELPPAAEPETAVGKKDKKKKKKASIWDDLEEQ